MKDHKKVERDISVYNTTTLELMSRIEEAAKELKNEFWTVPYYDELRVTGWRPFTEAEKATAKKRQAAAKKAAAVRKEKQAVKDRKELERLAKKLGVEVGT